MSGDLSELSRRIRELQDAEADARETPSVEQRMASIHEKLGLRSKQRRAAVRREYAKNFLAGALGAAAAVLLSWWFMQESPLVARHGDQPLAAGSWISSDGAAEAVAFSDGSQITLRPSSRGRIIALGEDGARFALESGKIHAEVVPRANNHWIVSAGPFEVLVTGTAFDASWDARSEELTVEMQHGSVRVSGGCLKEPRPLSGQESGRFSCAQSEPSADLRTGANDAQVEREPHPVATTTKTPSLGPEPRPATSSPDAGSAAQAFPPHGSAGQDAGSHPEEDWQSLARAGRFKPALAAAEALGFSSLCTSLSGEQVLELGNVARLAGNPSRASEAYLSARQRFPGSNAAASAAFQLGRLAFDGSKDYGSARRWFAAYLGERPGGGLGQEALGRLMESEHRLGDTAAASSHAAQYLRRFPDGPHAALARSIGGE